MKIFLALCFFLTCIAPGGGRQQDKQRPDLSGTWIAESESKKERNIETPVATKVVIEHQDPEFKVVRIDEVGGQKRKRESIYFTDKRGETNSLPEVAGASEKSRTESLKSKTAWEGDKVVIRVDILRRSNSGRMTPMEIIYQWKLSQDGQTLTETTIVKSDDRGTGSPDQGIAGVGRGEMRNTLKKAYRRFPS